jgi:hypothetical protein
MSTDLNHSATEGLESYGADNTADAEYRDDLDYDYEPPMPYDYRQQWADNPSQWAISYAANLIRTFGTDQDFYSNLDASTIEEWVFEDYPELLETLRNDNTLEEFRSGLSQHCRMLKGAALLANEILLRRRGMLSPLPSLSPECKEFFPEWVSKIKAEPEWSWHAELPGPIAELRGRWAETEFFNPHESNEIVPHSRLPRGERTDATPEDRQSVTAYVLERDNFVMSLKAATQERLAFFIKLPADVNIESLTKSDRTTLAVHKSDDGSSVWNLSFGSGAVSISVLEHEAILNRFRARLPVIYERDGEQLMVEYDWSPIAFGRGLIRMAQVWPAPEGTIADLSPRFVTKLSPEAMRIARTAPMSMAGFYEAIGVKFPYSSLSVDDDDTIPF